jgi:hypothetical protein
MEERMGNEIISLLKLLICHEPNLDSRLNLLTEIGLTSQNDEMFKACEEVRNELVGEEKV